MANKRIKENMENYHITALSDAVKERMKIKGLEKMKMDSWKLAKMVSTDEELLECLLLVIDSHYMRSSVVVLGNKENNPDFATFASHWLGAQEMKWSGYSDGVMSLAIKIYPPPKKLAISDHGSYWEPSLAQKYKINLTVPE